MFIAGSRLESVVEEVMVEGSQNPALIILACTILAIGARAENTAKPSVTDLEWVSCCFRFALVKVRLYQSGRASFCDFQVSYCYCQTP